MEKASLKERAFAFIEKHRRRLAKLSFLVFLALVVIEIGEAYPREVRVDVPLGAAHAEVVEARIDYSQGDESVRSLTLRWEEGGAPSQVRDTLDLSPGDYDVAVTLIEGDGERRALEGRISAPAEGVVRLALHPGEG